MQDPCVSITKQYTDENEIYLIIFINQYGFDGLECINFNNYIFMFNTFNLAWDQSKLVVIVH